MNQDNQILRKIWRLVYPVLIYFGISYLVSLIFSVVLSAGAVSDMMEAGGELNTEAMINAILNQYNQYLYEICLAGALAALPVLWLYFKKDRKEEMLKGTFVRYRSPEPWFYVCAFLMGMSLCIIINNMLTYSRIMDVFYESYSDTADVLFQGKFILELLGTGLLIPMTEETLFRGLVYNRMKESAPPAAAMFGSALFFAVFHGNLLQGIYAFLLGLVLAYCYEKFRNLAAPILIHAGANMVSVLASETSIFGFMYEEEGSTGFIAGTLIFCLVFLGTFYAVHTYVEAAPVDDNQI